MYLLIADTLSRAYLPQTPTPGKSDEEVERIHSVNFLPVSEPQIQETANDPVLQSLKAVILTGWPSESESLPSALHSILQYKRLTGCTRWYNLQVEDDKGPKCVIPTSLRPMIKEKLPRSHISIQGCLRRAREVGYWPNMNRELTEFISKCETCNFPTHAAETATVFP